MTKLGKSIQHLIVAFALIFGGVGFLCVGAGRANAPQTAHGEHHIIKLKNGSVIHGRVVRFDGREFTVLMPGTKSRAIIHVDDVESIEFGEEEKSERPLRQEGAGPASTAPGAQPEAQGEPLPPAKTEKPGQPEKAEKAAPPREKPMEPTAPLPRYVEIAVKVPANEVWVDATLDVQKGQKLRLAVTGRINISRTQSCGPEGIELKDPEKLLVDRPSGALIAVIGDDNDDFIFIGPRAEFQASRSGRLFLMVNDSRLEDNSGEFTVRIQVEELPSPAQMQG